MSTPPLLALEALSLQFAGHATPVVREVTLSIARGEKVPLVGESGSGKSVLARALLQLDAGLQCQGQIRLEGQPLLGVPGVNWRQIRGHRIAMIFQEPMSALNPLQRVGQQIAEVVQLHLGWPDAQAWQEAARLLAQTGIHDAAKLQRYPHQLSGGQRQRVMIAMALAGEPDLLIADEPTTALDVTVQAQILALLAQLQQQRGLAVLLISHDLHLVRRFAERVAVMQQGQLVEVAATETLFQAPRHVYTRQLLAARPQRVAPAVAAGAPVQLAVQGLSHAYPAPGRWFWQSRLQTQLQPLDFSLAQGETLAIVGESGSGKTTLALALLRLLAAGRSSGEVRCFAQVFSALRGAALARARRHMQLVFQDPFASLSPRQTVLELVEEGLLVHAPALSAAERRERVCAVLAEVGLPADILGRYPHAFSGGQRQRLALARALIVEPQILLLDEPTSALDASMQQQVLSLLATLQARRGLSYILITHDLAVVQALAHQVLVLKDGVVVERGPVAQVFAQPQQAYTQQLLQASEGYAPEALN